MSKYSKYNVGNRAVLFAGVFGSLIAAVANAVTEEDAVLNSGPQAVYERTCGYCHGDSGHNVGPLLKGRGLPVEYISNLVRGGRGAMPAFRPTEIGDGELTELAKWLAKSKK